jgi:hypothetical protein
LRPGIRTVFLAYLSGEDLEEVVVRTVLTIYQKCEKGRLNY